MKDITKLIQKKETEEDSFRKNVLEDLITQIDETTGMFNGKWEILIPQYERDDEFLWQVLTEMGYTYSCREEYNSYHECYCYMIRIKT